MHFIPRVIQNIVKESFQQTVVAQNFQGAILARIGQKDTVMFLILHQRRPEGSEFLEHARYGSSANTQMVGDRITRNARFFRPAQFQNRLQIIVRRFCTGTVYFRRH